MENNEIMNEETIKTSEEIVETSSSSGSMKATVVCLAIGVAGGLAIEHIVKPTIARVKDWRKKRKHEKEIGCNDCEPIDEDFEETIEESEE